MLDHPQIPIAVAMPDEVFAAYFDTQRREVLTTNYAVQGNLPLDLATIADADPSAARVLLTSWGTPQITAAVLDQFPHLELIIHCAGSVRGIVSEEVWKRGIKVTSSAAANAVPVAEYTLAAILMSGKRAPYFARMGADHGFQWEDFMSVSRMSNYDRTVGIVGFSKIGRLVVQLLQHFDGIKVLVSDPYADAEEVASYGASLVTLEQMLPQVDVLSLHAPDLPETRHMIAAPQLAALRDGATVINTARGALIDTPALEAECAQGRLDAIVDVTDPEPLPADSRLYQLPNVMVTPHIAGSTGTEIKRLTDMALQELARFTAGKELQHQVTQEQMAVTA